MRLIKKYDNRSLYDTELSTNISLDDIKKYVLDGIKFKVVNAKTEEDITRQYLMQIILDLDVSGAAFFSQTSLEYIIRFYASPSQKMLQQLLEQTLQMMDKQQQMYTDFWPNPNK